MSINKQYTVPETVLEATVKVLSSYQARLEKEAVILSNDPEMSGQAANHRKLIEVVRQLTAFYTSREDGHIWPCYVVRWCDHEGSQHERRFKSLEEAKLEARELRRTCDGVEVVRETK